MASKQVGAGTGGRDPELLPTPLLTPDRFEDFTETLLHRQRFVAGHARRLIEVSRWVGVAISRTGSTSWAPTTTARR